MIYIENVPGTQEISIPRSFGAVTPTRPEYVREAPRDGKTYGRKDGRWVLVLEGYSKAEIDALLRQVVHTTGDESIRGLKRFSAIDAEHLEAGHIGVDFSELADFEGNTLFDILAGKANNQDAVHKSGNETIAGIKHFTGLVKLANGYIPTREDGVIIGAEEVDEDNGEIYVVGDTRSFTFVVERDPEAPMEVATKNYVDALAARVAALEARNH